MHYKYFWLTSLRLPYTQPTINHQGLSNFWVFKIIPFVVAFLSIWQTQKSVLSHECECNCPTKHRRKTDENILILYNKRDLVLRGSARDCACIKKISTGIRVKGRGFWKILQMKIKIVSLYFWTTISTSDLSIERKASPYVRLQNLWQSEMKFVPCGFSMKHMPIKNFSSQFLVHKGKEKQGLVTLAIRIKHYKPHPWFGVPQYDGFVFAPSEEQGQKLVMKDEMYLSWSLLSRGTRERDDNGQRRGRVIATVTKLDRKTTGISDFNLLMLHWNTNCHRPAGQVDLLSLIGWDFPSVLVGTQHNWIRGKLLTDAVEFKLTLM